MAEIGGNITELKKDISSAINNVNGLKADRSAINEEIAAVRAKMEALGINKAAFDMAMRYLSWEPEKREGFDLAYSLVREAGGLPVDKDLFEAADEREQNA